MCACVCLLAILVKIALFWLAALALHLSKMAASVMEGPCTLIVRNLPPDVKEPALEKVFCDIGPLKRCFVVRDKSDKAACKGIAYVTYASSADASTALTRNFKYEDNVLSVKIAASRPAGGAIALKQTVPRSKVSKKDKLARKKRKARLIVRNLSFKATEETLRDCFGKYGDITEISIPRKPDGKMRGFAFVQFCETKNAIKAINGLNASNIHGRPVAVDFSLPKTTYEQATKSKTGDELEKQDGDNGNSDDELGSVSSASGTSGKGEHQSVTSEEVDMQETDDSEQDIDDDKEDSESSEDDNECPKKLRPQKSDTKNTLFIRNISFETTQDSLEALLKQFGPYRYCLLCRDPVTDHSKGTAFIHYLKASSIEQCMKAAESGSGLMLDGRRLSITNALSREDLEKRQKLEKKQKKDNRHLYLAREGLIRPGTEAAHGVSPQDMAKRAKLQSRKRKLLQNLHYFISQTRLSVHNLPPFVDDRKLRALFLQSAPSGARITEARVMRNLKSPNGESLGYGFVTFTRHEDALEALRQLNNNPETFNPKKRPIVEFCLENRAALVAKERRLQRSKQKLQEKEQAGASQQGTSMEGAQVKLDKRTPFMGAASNPNMKGLPTHSGPKVRTKKGRAGKQNLQMKEKKGKRKLKQRKAAFTKSNDAREERDSFATMVAKHKQSKEAVPKRRKKWFQSQ